MDVDIRTIFASRLFSCRRIRNLTQGQLADRSGLQLSAISHFEKGRRTPSIINLVKLADALDVKVDHLLGRDEYVAGNGYGRHFKGGNCA